MPKIRLAKTGDSRTRGKAKAPVLSKEALRLKEQFKNGDAGFIDYLLNKGYSSTTVTRYVTDAACFEAWAKEENVPVEAVSYADILHYIQGRRSQVKQRTLGACINSIKHYFNFLSASGSLAENPVSQITIRGVKRRQLYDILKKQELESLYHDYEITHEEKHRNQNWYRTSVLNSKRNKVIVGLLVYQGLNATALFRLRESDVRLREGKIFIAGTRKSNERELTLEAVQMLDLMEYILKVRQELLNLTGKQSDKLLVSSGRGSEIHNALQVLVRQLKRQNSKIIGLNQIRTSVITHWLRTHNIRKVQYMAGHRFVSSTEAFLINDLDDLQEDIGKFHPIG